MKCPICGNDKFELVVSNEEMRFKCWGIKSKGIWLCKKCNLQLLSPQWSSKKLNEIYKDYNTQKDFTNQKVASGRTSKYLDKFIRKNDRVLEIGCGVGLDIKRIRRLFNFLVITLGIDKDPSVCNSLNNIYNYDFIHMPFSNFNFIYGIHVFEHEQRPRQFINKLKKSLKYNGRFLLELPNSEEPLLTLYKIDAFKKFYYVPHHVYIYNPENIQHLFNNLGLVVDIKRYQRYGLINHLRWLIFKRPGNVNFHIPILDNIYKWIIVNIFKKSDTMIITGEKN